MREAEFTPSRKQIRAACRRIRRTWTAEELQKRIVGPIDRVAYTIPEVSAKSLFGYPDRGE
jgi:hypothetical protein